MDNPGVWEHARYAYLHEALIGKQAIAATLAVLLAHVLQRLLVRGVIDFVVRMDVSIFDRQVWQTVTSPEGQSAFRCGAPTGCQVLNALHCNSRGLCSRAGTTRLPSSEWHHMPPGTMLRCARLHSLGTCIELVL